MRSRFNMASTYNPWTQPSGKAPPKLTGTSKNPRVLDVLNISWGSRKPALRGFPWWTDWSQMVDRKPWGTTVPCLTKSSRLYSFGDDESIGATSMLALQGWPMKEVVTSSLKESELAEIAGEGMFLPNVATILMALYLSPTSPWWSSPTASSSSASVAAAS